MLFTLSLLLLAVGCLGCAQAPAAVQEATQAPAEVQEATQAPADVQAATQAPASAEGTVSMLEPIAGLPWGTTWDDALTVLGLEAQEAPVTSAEPGKSTTQLTVENVSAAGLTGTAILTFRVFTDASGAATAPLFTGLRLLPAEATGAKAALLEALGLEESQALTELPFTVPYEGETLTLNRRLTTKVYYPSADTLAACAAAAPEAVEQNLAYDALTEAVNILEVSPPEGTDVATMLAAADEKTLAVYAVLLEEMKSMPLCAAGYNLTPEGEATSIQLDGTGAALAAALS